MSQALSVLPSVVSSLVFLSQMGVGKGSQEKTGVTFWGTSLSLPGTELLNLVLLICSLWGFDRFCLKDKCPAAPKKSSSQTFQNLWCLLVLLQWCSKWRKIPLHSEKILLKLCAIYRSSQVMTQSPKIVTWRLYFHSRGAEWVCPSLRFNHHVFHLC